MIGFSEARIAYVSWRYLDDEPAARLMYSTALTRDAAETWQKHYHCEWARMSRGYISCADFVEEENRQEEEKKREELRRMQEEEAERAREEEEMAKKYSWWRDTGKGQWTEDYDEQPEEQLTITPPEEDPEYKITLLTEKARSIYGHASLLEFLHWVYEVFTPTDPATQKQLQKILRANSISHSDFRNFILIYHPDKNHRFGEPWISFCQEVTKV